jgi:hypothetical protein
MAQVTKHSELKNAVKLFNAMVKDNLGYIYRGSFNDDIADSILDLTEVSLKTEEQSSKIKKRVYAIMVEGLQNITRHQDTSPEISSDHKSIFVIQKVDEKYYITTGNIIETQHIQHIKELIEKINGLNKDELKEYYKQVLEEGTLSKKGGAGLGLIDMAKKSGNRLSYQFKPLPDGLNFFYLHTVPSLMDDQAVEKDGQSNSLDHIVHIHELLNKEDALMIFNGIFNQESYSSLILSLQKNISESKNIQNKFFYIIAELLKNIVKHGEKTELNHNGNPGIFYLSQSDSNYLITTGNYIVNEKVDQVCHFIDHINSLSPSEIDLTYKQILTDETANSSINQAFGFIDIRKETNRIIQYSVAKVNKKCSFISIRVELNSSPLQTTFL